MLVLVLALQLAAANPPELRPGTVLVFTTTDCPISNRYAPEVQRLAARFDGTFRFTLVYPVPADSDAKIRDHIRTFGYQVDWARDPGGALVKRTGVTVTPEVAVIGADGGVAYRGRIDDRYVDFGTDRPQPTVRDLERALEAIAAGKPVPVARTRAVGCILADLLK